MRLIDADNASDAKFPTVPEGISEVYVKGWNDAIDAVVENAPTIEHSKNSLDYDYGFAEGLRRAREKKGKWKVIGFVDDYAYCTCSECGKTTRLYRDSKNEFCCIADIRNTAIACLYCGADMREVDNEQ